MDGPGWLTRRRCQILAAVLIGGTALLRLIYLACNCPLNLSQDEAHYWDWSRHLDWSYYSKGPGVAWLIRISCELCGGLSVWLTGNEMLAVRLPAVICGSLLLASLYVLTVQCIGSHGVALAVVAAALTTPAMSAGSTLMTIDAPYTCCWGWALVFAHRAVFQRSANAWFGVGMLVGLGVLFKYTMILWIPSLACFLLFSREHRALLWSRGFWVMCGVVGIICSPILIWNVQNDWSSLHHVNTLAGLNQDKPTVHWLGPLRYVGVQCGLWLVFWFVVWARGMLANAPWKNSTSATQYLWWMSAPMFAVFLLFAFKTDGGEPNWPVTAYISGIVLGVAWLADDLRKASGWYRRFVVGGMAAACAVGVLLVVMVHYSALAHPLLRLVAGEATAAQPFPLRRVDPTLRLRGWLELAKQVDEVRFQLIQHGEEPVLAGVVWTMPGLMGFYCADQPAVYSFGAVFGDRHSQYDLWQPNPIAEAEKFLNRTFVIVCQAGLDPREAFASVETHSAATHLESGELLGEWVILVCRGYKGFGGTEALGAARRY